MNKLEVAIKLLRLLNERKTITSKVIADELNVSIRTAQRYIQELSALPCFVNQQNYNTYELYPNYKLKDALLNSSVCEIISKKLQNKHQADSIGEVLCLVCGGTRNKFDHSLLVFDVTDIDNTKKFEQLVDQVRNMLKAKKCNFPEGSAPEGLTDSHQTSF